MRVTSSDGKQYTIEPGANLSGANLSNASLSGARLSRAILSNANLSMANLSEAQYNKETVFPEGFEPSTDMHFIGPNPNLSGTSLNGVTSDDKTAYSEGFDSPTGIGLLRVLAWIWLILCPIGGIVFWVEWAELEKVLDFDESMLGLQLFLAATLSGLVTFAVFLVLCTIAENLIAIKNVVASNTQQRS